MNTPDTPYNQTFAAFLDTLNPEQRKAVDQTEGPVMVLAGPGTGKTQVLAARIGNILLTTDARPQNILCLTFTDAGVRAMRQRLLHLIGPTAHRVPIMTYHSFCNRVIQENIQYFGQYSLETLTDIERIGIVQTLLSKLKPDHPLREGQRVPFAYEKQLRHLFELMKRERWKPGEIHRATRKWLQELPQQEDFIYKKNSQHGKKGELKQAKAADEAQKMKVLAAAADLFPDYLRALEQAGRYEYEDMLLWTIAAFEQHPELLRNYQERYQYVLVDEFQDTNGAQNNLLQLLLNYWDSPNIFIVGDDDQSIYEFQGARLQNLLELYQQYRKDLLMVVLTRNYRSLQPILDAAHAVIGQNQIRAARHFELPVEKQLQAQRTDTAGLQLQQWAYPNALAEDTAIADQIQQLLANGTDPEHIAVICYMHSQYKRLIDLLDKRGVAYQTKRPVNLLELPLIQQLREVLCYLHEESQQPFSGEHRLFALLHAPFFHIPALELAKFALAQQKNEGTTWREALMESPWPYARALVQLPALALSGASLSQLIPQILTQLGMMNHVLGHPDKAWHTQVLYTWLQWVEANEARNPKLKLGDLLLLLDNMETHRIALPLVQQIQTGKGIHLLTAHAAKGLEFEHVFVPHCTKDTWEPGSKGRVPHFAYPPTLVLSGEEDAMEARRRLFFVAITRAKTQLHISYSLSNDQGKPQDAARFLDETGLDTHHRPLDAEGVLQGQLEQLQPLAQPVVTLPDPALLGQYLERFSLSAKSLNKYLRCPLAFYYEEILKVPSASSEAGLVGSATHLALQQFFLEMQGHPQREFPPADRLVALLEKAMARQAHHFSPTTYEQRLTTARNTLYRYAVEQVPFWKKRARVELNLRQVMFRHTLLNGTLDKVEYLDNGHLRIVDYKTGAYKKPKIARPSEEQPWGGEYFRQLLFYKILVENSQMFTETANKGVISWIDPDKKGNFKNDELEFSTQDAQWMETLIVEVWDKIQAREFTTGCGKKDCAWCNMHRDRQFDELPEDAELDLDDE